MTCVGTVNNCVDYMGCSPNCNTCDGESLDKCSSCKGNLILDFVDGEQRCNCPDGEYIFSMAFD